MIDILYWERGKVRTEEAPECMTGLVHTLGDRQGEDGGETWV